MRPLFGTLFSFALTFPGCFQAAPRLPKAETPALAAVVPRVGQPAPEITGEDLDGVVFKLSDYRGKVVVLDFWGHW
jgi:hypothetical protein